MVTKWQSFMQMRSPVQRLREWCVRERWKLRKANPVALPDLGSAKHIRVEITNAQQTCGRPTLDTTFIQANML